MISAFISYAHADERLKVRLLTHLRALTREGLVQAWHDRMLLPGSQLDNVIEQELSASSLVLLLISPDFINSDYCTEREMQRAFARAKAGDCQVVVVICESCQWRNIPIESGGKLGDFLAIPQDGRAVSEWPNENSVLNDVVAEVRRLILAGRGRGSGPVTAAAPQAGSKAPVASGSTSNHRRRTELGLPPRVIDLDREQFLERSFEYMAASFERDLGELQLTNQGVSCRFQRRDSQTFVASVYVDGKSIGGVRVFRRASFSGRESICLSYELHSNENSWNEEITVQVKDGQIVLSAMGMPHLSKPDLDLSKLDQDGSASYFWELLINHIRSHSRSFW